MYLLYALQTFSSDLHFLILPHIHLLNLTLLECVYSLVTSMAAVPHLLTDPSSASYHAILEKIINNMSIHETKVHYLILNLPTELTPSVSHILQHLNAIVQNEHPLALLGPSSMAKIISHWRSIPSHQNATDSQILLAIQPAIQNRLRIILVPAYPFMTAQSSTDPSILTLQSLQSTYPKLLSHLFIISPPTNLLPTPQPIPDPMPETTMKQKGPDPNLLTSLEHLMQKIYRIEGKFLSEGTTALSSPNYSWKKLVLTDLVNSLWIHYSHPGAYLDLEKLDSWTVDDYKGSDFPLFGLDVTPAKGSKVSKGIKYNKDLVLKCCVRLREASLSIGEPVLLKKFGPILGMVALYSIFLAGYSFSLKQMVLKLVKKELDVEKIPLMGAVLEGERYYDRVYSKLEETFFLSDQVCEDIFTVQVLIRHTQVSGLYIHDPFGYIVNSGSVVREALSVTGTGEDVHFIDKESVDEIRKEEYRGKVLIIRDISEEDYMKHVHELLCRLHEEYLVQSMEVAWKKKSKKEATRIVLVFSKKPEFIERMCNMVSERMG